MFVDAFIDTGREALADVIRGREREVFEGDFGRVGGEMGARNASKEAMVC